MADYSNHPTVVYWRRLNEVWATHGSILQNNQDKWPGDVAVGARNFAAALQSIPMNNIDWELQNVISEFINLMYDIGNFNEKLARALQLQQQYENSNFNVGFNGGYNLTSGQKPFWENLFETALGFIGSELGPGVDFRRARAEIDREGQQLDYRHEQFVQHFNAVMQKLQSQYGTQYIY